MFGIGLPEMILILALALIVVGPDKLPDLARSLARTILDLKKTAESLKASFREEGNPLDEIRPELEDAARSLKGNLLEQPAPAWNQDSSLSGVNQPSPASLPAKPPAFDADSSVPREPASPDARPVDAERQPESADFGVQPPSSTGETTALADEDDRK
jgi:sec-independent protein translocase protein TatB